MERELLIDGVAVPYHLVVSDRARHLRMTIKPGGEIRVTLPRRARPALLDVFLSDHKDWILKKWRVMSTRPKKMSQSESRAQYEAYKEAARKLVHERILFFNTVYAYSFGAVAIRNQKTRWGSCSKKGNLNFNYKVALLPPGLADYVVVHELCHLKEFNHSERFWKLVELIIPDYKERRKVLRKEGLSI